jgi:hypothetical protein
MTLMRRLPIIAAALFLLGLTSMPAAHAAEEQTIKVFSAFRAQGQFMKTGDHEATFIGMIAGPVYIDTDQGPVDGGTISCPIVVHINLKDATQKARGNASSPAPRATRPIWS